MEAQATRATITQGESINVDKPGSPSTPDPFGEKELPENKGEPIDVDLPEEPDPLEKHSLRVSNAV